LLFLWMVLIVISCLESSSDCKSSHLAVTVTRAQLIEIISASTKVRDIVKLFKFTFYQSDPRKVKSYFSRIQFKGGIGTFILLF